MSENPQEAPASAPGAPVVPVAPVTPTVPAHPVVGGAYVQTTPGAPPVYVAVDPHPPVAPTAPVVPSAPVLPAVPDLATPFATPAPTPASAAGTSRLLGVSALIVALAGVIAATLVSSFAGFEAARGAVAHAGLSSLDSLEYLSDDQALALLSPVRARVLWGEIGFWAGGLLGVWAIVQGIVAIATRRGRGPGIAAVVVAAAGPIFYGVAVTIAVLAGLAIGTQSLP